MAKILWACPWSPHDTSSGAAWQVRFMLEKLAERGVEVMALSSFLFDGQTGYDLFARRVGLGEKLAGPERLFHFTEGGVSYAYTRSASWNAELQTRREQTEFFSAYHAILDSFRPDVVMGYGGDCLDIALKAEAKLRGLGVVTAVYNGNYTNSRFAFTDMVITDSAATAALYAKQRVNVLPLGVFIRPEEVRAPERNPAYIVCVNPLPAKGAALFARLALMAERERPDLRFLLVQGRGDPAADFALLRDADEPLSHPLAGRHFSNITFAPHTADMRGVYSSATVLLAPSLWFESFGRVAAEAMLNGVPVLASNRGGLPETVGDGGLCLSPPPACREDWLRLPTEAEMRPWFDALQALCDPAARSGWEQRALKAAAVHNIERSADNVLTALQPLLACNAGSLALSLSGSAFR